jgi:hypothetical protein
LRGALVWVVLETGSKDVIVLDFPADFNGENKSIAPDKAPTAPISVII